MNSIQVGSSQKCLFKNESTQKENRMKTDTETKKVITINIEFFLTPGKELYSPYYS